MPQFNKEIMAALAQKQDLDEVFRQHLETAIKALTAAIHAMGIICGPLRLSMENQTWKSTEMAPLIRKLFQAINAKRMV